MAQLCQSQLSAPSPHVPDIEIGQSVVSHSPHCGPYPTVSPEVRLPCGQFPKECSFPSGRFPQWSASPAVGFPSGQFPGGQCRSVSVGVSRSVSVGVSRSVSVSFPSGQFPQWSVSPVSFPRGQCCWSVSRGPFPQWSVSASLSRHDRGRLWLLL